MSTPSEEIRLVATLVAKPGKEEALRAALDRLIPQVHTEPGCIQYTLHTAIERPRTFVFYEVWKDAAALDAHGKTPHFQAFAAALDGLLDAPLDIVTLRVAV